MVNFLKPAVAHRLVACLTTIVFTTSVVIPSHAYGRSPVNLDLGAINFGIKAEKIYDKIKQCIDKKETNKIINHMFDLKSEVEQYTNQKIDILQ